MADSDSDPVEDIAVGFLTLIFGALWLVIGGIVALFKWQHDKKKDSEFADLIETVQQAKPKSLTAQVSAQNAKIIGLSMFGVCVFMCIAAAIKIIGVEWAVAGVFLGGAGLLLAAFGSTPVQAETETPTTDATETPTSSKSIAYSFTITLPRSTVWQPEQALQFMAQILEEFGTLVFQIVADHTAISWRIIDMNQRLPDPIERSIRDAYPDAQVVVAPFFAEELPFPFYRFVGLYQHTNLFIAPMRFVTNTKQDDPLVKLVQAMDALQSGERITYTVYTLGFAADAYAEAERIMTQPAMHPIWLLTPQGRGEALARAIYGTDRTPRFRPEDQRVLEDKCAQPLYQTILFVQFDSSSAERVAQLANIDSHLVNFGTVYNRISRYPQYLTERIVEILDDDTDLRLNWLGTFYLWMKDPKAHEGLRRITRLILDPRELALLWHLPHAGFAARRIQWMNARQVEAPTAPTSAEGGIEIGKGVLRGKRVPVYLKVEDRTSHIWIMGKTGFGKSSLLYQMITCDIAAGHGVAVVDPHGTLVQDVLRCGIPLSRADDVVVLDLADTEHPVPLNLLRGKLEFTRIGQIISIIERLFPDTAEYARLSRYLRASITLACEDPEATLIDVLRVFRDDAYREQLVAKTTDDDLALTWEEYGRFKEGERSRIVEPVHSRLSAFIGNPSIRPLLCHPDTIDFRTLIQQNKIILISLKMDDLQVPELEQDILGAMLVSQLQLSGMKDAASPYYIYIDEVQRFVTSSLKQLFSEARKFKLSLTVAHQYLQQLKNDTLDAIQGNAGMSIFFQLSPHDAQAVRYVVAPEFHPDDIVNLDKFQAVVKMPSDQSTQPAFTLYTNPPPTKEEKIASAGREVWLRRESHDNWTPKTTNEVKDWLKQRYRRSVRVDDQSQFMDSQ